jgi:hypothetical protein
MEEENQADDPEPLFYPNLATLYIYSACNGGCGLMGWGVAAPDRSPKNGGLNRETATQSLIRLVNPFLHACEIRQGVECSCGEVLLAESANFDSRADCIANRQLSQREL